MLYTLKSYSAVCQLYLNKTGKKNYFMTYSFKQEFKTFQFELMKPRDLYILLHLQVQREKRELSNFSISTRIFCKYS